MDMAYTVRIILCAGGGIVLLHCVLYLRKTFSFPLLYAFLSLLLVLAILVGTVFLFTSSFDYPAKNENYDEELAAWEERKEEASGKDLFLLLLHKPDETIRVEPSNAATLYVLCYTSGGLCCAAVCFYFVYFFVCLSRFIKPLALRRKNKKEFSRREAAYAQIEKFHEYKEKGIMTEEEYQENRQRILDTLQ